MIKNVVIAGAGTMGYSMAEIFAVNHYSVTVYDIYDSALENAKNKISPSINEIINYTTSKDCFKDCDIVIESIIENMDIKKNFYIEISEIVKKETILATNTSGLSINEIARFVKYPERFLGMHWFNPPSLVPLIEIIENVVTDKQISQEIFDLALNINKKPVIIQKDVPGFVANRIQFAVLRECLQLVEDGVVSIEGIDNVMKYGLGFRYACLGPLEIADFGGLDTFYHISEYLMKDLCKSPDVPNLLKKYYENNYFGVKNKKGFYDYQDGKDIEATKLRNTKFEKLYDCLYKSR